MDLKEYVERALVDLVVYGLMNTEENSTGFQKIYNSTLDDYDYVMDGKVIYA